MGKVSEITELKEQGLNLTFESAVAISKTLSASLREAGRYYGYGDKVVQMLVPGGVRYNERGMNLAIDRVMKNNIFKTKDSKFKEFIVDAVLNGDWSEE